MDERPPRVLVVEHEEHCSAARLGDWLVAEGCRLDVWRPYTDAAELTPSALDDADALLVLGGTMDSWDDERAPWLPATRSLIRAAAQASIPTLGICLGHQLCALAFAGEVGRNPHGQTVGLVGITHITHHRVDDDMPLALPDAGVFWNDDVVTRLPDGARVLATGPQGMVAAAAYAPTVWGVQWHPEIADGVPAAWAAGDADRHLRQGIDQSAVIADVARSGERLTADGRALARSFAARAAARARSRVG